MIRWRSLAKTIIIEKEIWYNQTKKNKKTYTSIDPR